MRVYVLPAIFLAVTLGFFLPDANAQDAVRRLDENGAEIIETRRTVRQPITVTHTEAREETVYREEYITRMHEQQQTYYEPVTEYRYEPRVHGALNPFRQRTIVYHLVPKTRWEPRTHTVRTPVTHRQVVPETRTVEVPHRQLGFQQQEQVSRTAVAPSRDAVRTARNQVPVAQQTRPLGGVSQLDGDHPRYGLRTDISGGRY